MKCIHSLSIQKAENHKETSLCFLFHVMCTGLLYFYYSEQLSVAQGKILISSESFKKENKSLQVLSESYNKYVLPLNSSSFHLALLSVLKLCISKVTFSGPSPMHIVVHGTSIQAWYCKKYYLRELKFLQCNGFGYKEF